MSVVPAQVMAADGPVRVERAWPSRGRLTFAGTDGYGRVRAGSMDRRGHPRVLPHADDPDLPGLVELARQGTLVAHRPRKRAVVAVPGAFVKLTRADAAPLAERAALAARLAAAAGFDAAQVLDCSDHQLRCSVVPGTDAHRLGGSADLDRWRDWWEQFAQGWVGLVGADATVPAVHDAAAEWAVAEQWVARGDQFGAVDPEAAGRGLSRLRAELPAEPGPTGICHRDLHDKQLLFGDGRVGILDFDTLAHGELALDLANLLEHAALRHRQQRWSAAAATVVEQVVLSLADRLQIPPQRLAAYRRATRLRLGCVYAFRPPWRDLAAELLLEAADENTLIGTSSTTPDQRKEWGP